MRLIHVRRWSRGHDLAATCAIAAIDGDGRVISRAGREQASLPVHPTIRGGYTSPVLVYINTSGSHGDVHPFLAIGRALRSRGHEVVVFTHPFYARDVAAAGLGHEAIGAEIDHEAVLRDPRLMDSRKGGRLVMEMIATSAPGAMEIIRAVIERRRPDVFLAHHICLGSRWICNDAGVPIAIAVLAPMFWFSSGDPVPTTQRSPGTTRALGARLMMAALRPLLPLVIDRWVNRLRTRTGFPSERGAFMHDLHGGDVNLGMWSPHFRPPNAGDPDRTVTCGFPWYDRTDVGEELDADLASFLAEGDPPVIFTLGTAAVYTPGDFYEIAADVCARIGRRGVLLTGAAQRAPASLPERVRAFGYAPFSLVLPRGCATVHHGGIGSTAQALRAGRPSVVVPHAHDQFNNAVRVVGLGAGTMVHRRRLNARRLAAALRLVLDDRAMAERCVELGQSLAREDGAAVAATAIEGISTRIAR